MLDKNLQPVVVKSESSDSSPVSFPKGFAVAMSLLYGSAPHGDIDRDQAVHSCEHRICGDHEAGSYRPE